MADILGGLVLVNGNLPLDIREEDGEKYSAVLTPRNEARDVTLHFALYNKTKAGWLKKYFAFINFLKKGKDGWLDIAFPQLDLTLRVRYTDSPKFTPLTYLWQEGVHAGKVPRAGTDYITIQRRFEYAFNDIR